ncbi:MAG: hypothetical protein PWP45_826, partial [Tepidanaerobacteraceae bacterium]|nr:hypothetical protein [Tepidanaerobacteraceae bacterium]
MVMRRFAAASRNYTVMTVLNYFATIENMELLSIGEAAKRLGVH